MDQRNGFGRQYFADNSKYEGEWVDDQCQGQGILIHKNGDTYEGQFHEGKYHGTGKLKNFDGNV